jgi:hypothetical protein
MNEHETENRSDFIGMAQSECVKCNGLGLRSEHHNSKHAPCDCVLRKVTRSIVAKVHELEARGNLHSIRLDTLSRPQGRNARGIKGSEYKADVFLTARRALPDPVDWLLFRSYCLENRPWRECCPWLGRGQFFQKLYLIEARLGLCFLEMRPYALFPVSQYWDTRLEKVRPCPIPEDYGHKNGIALRPPIAPRRAIFLVPAPVPVVPALPEPEPAPLDIHDIATVAAYARRFFRVGKGMQWLAVELTRLNVPGPHGATWRAWDVKHLLLDNPRPARSKPVKLAA